MNYIAKYLKETRENLNLSQEAFAKWLRIPLPTLRNWEQGNRMPPLYVIHLIKFKIEHSTQGTQIDLFDILKKNT